MHMSLQQSNEAHAIADLVIGTFAFVILAALGTLMWEAGTQKAKWCPRVVAVGFWSLGGSLSAATIGIFLDTFHWMSPAQDKFFDHLIPASLISSLILVIGGATIGVLMDTIPDRK